MHKIARGFHIPHVLQHQIRFHSYILIFVTLYTKTVHVNPVPKVNIMRMFSLLKMLASVPFPAQQL